MDLLNKSNLLGEAARFDLCSQQGRFSRAFRSIYYAVQGGNRCIPLFKTLLSSRCQNNCLYCPIRAGRDIPRAYYAPEELADIFFYLLEKGYVRGLFLSSAVDKSPLYSMTRMIDAVEIVRKRGFKGYIHLKILPGADLQSVERAMQLADRVSINFEAPTQFHLSRLSREKFMEDFMQKMEWLRKLSQRIEVPAGFTTQFVVGAAGESDFDILSFVDMLYSEYSLRRAYYSAFYPVAGTPLGDFPPTPKLRENRLYQADFLLRKYKFSFEELPFDKKGNLPRNQDPKLASALMRKDFFPLEINKASLEELLRVPGIGPISARRILEVRKTERITSLETLKKLGAATKRAKHFITINGRYFGTLDKIRESQLPLF
jgi:predicted DNA-binding helix-hairpin-helix protein